MLGLEQHDHPDVRGVLRRLVARNQTHQLDAEALRIGQVTRHVAHHAAIPRNDQDGPQWQYHPALRDRNHGALHQVDALAHRQQATYFGAAQHADFHAQLPARGA
jgi:hypothetical protein